MVHVAELEHIEASFFGEKGVLCHDLDVSAEPRFILSITIIQINRVQVCVPVQN